METRKTILKITPAIVVLFSALVVLSIITIHPLLDAGEIERDTEIDTSLVTEADVTFASPPWVNYNITEHNPVILFHQRKAGGSSLRTTLATAARALNLTFFIICHASVPCDTYSFHNITSASTDWSCLHVAADLATMYLQAAASWQMCKIFQIHAEPTFINKCSRRSIDLPLKRALL